MTAHFGLGVDDLIAFNMYHSARSPTARRVRSRALWVFPVVWLAIFTLLWWLADRERGTPLQTFRDLSPLLYGLPLYFIVVLWAQRRQVPKVIAKMVKEGENLRTLCAHEVTLTPKDITDATEFGHSTTIWRAIERIAATPDHVFIYTGATDAVIVPRRAFDDMAQFTAFVMTAERYHASALNGTSVPAGSTLTIAR